MPKLFLNESVRSTWRARVEHIVGVTSTCVPAGAVALSMTNAHHAHLTSLQVASVPSCFLQRFLLLCGWPAADTAAVRAALEVNTALDGTGARTKFLPRCVHALHLPWANFGTTAYHEIIWMKWALLDETLRVPAVSAALFFDADVVLLRNPFASLPANLPALDMLYQRHEHGQAKKINSGQLLMRSPRLARAAAMLQPQVTRAKQSLDQDVISRYVSNASGFSVGHLPSAFASHCWERHSFERSCNHSLLATYHANCLGRKWSKEAQMARVIHACVPGGLLGAAADDHATAQQDPRAIAPPHARADSMRRGIGARGASARSGGALARRGGVRALAVSPEHGEPHPGAGAAGAGPAGAACSAGSSACACGYVCARGSPDGFDEASMRAELPAFAAAYHDQRAHFRQENAGGNGAFHALAIWTVVRALRPSAIVESGVHRGQMSRLLRLASARWTPTLVRIDPSTTRRWEDSVTPTRTVDLTARNYTDFAEVRWASLGIDVASALVVMDDHQDHLQRIEQAARAGFRHLLFDDNFVPGVGDIFSVKNACDGGLGSEGGGAPAQAPCGGGDLRRHFGPPRRCTNFHSSCTSLGPKELAAARERLLRAVDVIWEVPPIAAVDAPYQAVRKYIRPGGTFTYDGPVGRRWTQLHTELARQSIKPPLFPSSAEAASALNVSTGYLRTQATQYLNMVYVRLAPQGRSLSNRAAASML